MIVQTAINIKILPFVTNFHTQKKKKQRSQKSVILLITLKFG